MGPQRGSLCSGVFDTQNIQSGAHNTAVTLTFTLHSVLVTAQAGAERSLYVWVWVCVGVSGCPLYESLLYVSYTMVSTTLASRVLPIIFLRSFIVKYVTLDSGSFASY